MAAGSIFSLAVPVHAKDIQWSGYTWHVRSGDNGGPGPNNWSADNVWIDNQKRLHLKIAHTGDKWSCAEIWTDKRLGFGIYQFDIDGHPENLDDNVVLGLFNYTEPDIGPDGTNEIDIEFATWGGQQKKHGNWTVWPALAGADHDTHTFTPEAGKASSINSFLWSRDAVQFGYLPQNDEPIHANPPGYVRWSYSPADSEKLIPRHPEPVHINLWLFNGKPPTDDKEVEVVISRFRFAPGNGQ